MPARAAATAAKAIPVPTIFSTIHVNLQAAPCCFLGWVTGVGRTADVLVGRVFADGVFVDGVFVDGLFVVGVLVEAPAPIFCISILEGRGVGTVHTE
jgi:hypothetical protein